MYKELAICVVTVIVIVLLNILTGNYTKNSVSELTGELMQLRSQMTEENIEDKEIYNKVKDIYENWREKYNVLTYYLEHDELEKVENNLTSFRSAIDAKEYSEALKEIDETTFVLRHIQEKNSFDLKNIF